MLLNHPVGQRNFPTPKSINCSSQGPRARARLEPLTSHPSSASTSLASRWVSTALFDRADARLLNFPNCLRRTGDCCRSLKPLSILLSPESIAPHSVQEPLDQPSSCHADCLFVHEVEQLVLAAKVTRRPLVSEPPTPSS